jgi:ABC-type lipopolysaccharide export system ATPase subunit
MLCRRAESAHPRRPHAAVRRTSAPRGGSGRSYERTRALSALSFQVHAGEILGSSGPNGAGKTTALRSIAGVLPIQEGRVLVCGHDVAREEVRRSAPRAGCPTIRSPSTR